MTSVRTARRRDLRLAPAAGAAWVCAAVLTQHPVAAVPASIGLWMLVVSAVALGARARGGWRTALAVVAICAGAGAAVASHIALAEPARAAAVALPHEGGRTLTMHATVVGKVEPTATGWRMDAVAHEATVGVERVRLHAPVRIRVSGAQPGLDLGAVIEVRGTAAPARPGERAVLAVTATTVTVTRAPAGVLGAASTLRHGLQEATAGLPEPAAGLIAGLSVGDTSRVSGDLDADMKTSSLSHLTAVSGANCALVTGIAFALAALCGAPRAVRVLVGLATLTGFVVLVSPEPSVVRAAAMAVIAMLGVLLGRIGAGVSILALSVAVLLAIDPWLAGSIGFALSAAATASLLLAAGPLADGLSRWMPQPLALALSVPLAAQLACGPLIVLITPAVPLYGVVANILAAPTAPAGTVLGLIACLAAGIPIVGSVLASGLAALAWLPAAWIAATAQTFSALPASTVPWLEDMPGLVALGVVGTAVGVLVAGKPAWARAPAAMACALGAGTMLALGPIAGIVDRARVPDGWRIAACDIGQGDALLLRSAGRVALIDTGPDPAALTQCLDLFGIERIDLLVLTHFDNDHDGGSDAVIGRVDAVWHGPPETSEEHALLDEFAANGAHVTAVTAGLEGRFGESRWRVLWPRADERARGNDASVVVEWEGGGVPRSLFLGDLSAETQRTVRRALGSSAYPVVKVAHHGSGDQDAALYRAARPALALVTVGENTYGHPRESILSVLQSLGSAVARTDLDGAVAVRVGDDGALHVWRQRGGDADE